MNIEILFLNRQMKLLKPGKIIKNCLLLFLGLLSLYISYTFRLNLIRDLFWEKIDQVMIRGKEDDYGIYTRSDHDGSLAGLPAGEGVTELVDIDQFYGLQMKGLDFSDCEGWWDYESAVPIEHSEYITFEADSIIPLGYYRLGDTMSGHGSGSYITSSGFRISQGASAPVYTDSKFLGGFYWYNQYYLVRLPDGNYVPAFLDDAYYIRYLLTGKVQLPLGVAVIENRYHSNGWADLRPYLEEYGVSNERILSMFCETRCYDLTILYGVFQFVAWIFLMFIGVNCDAVIEALLLKKPILQHLKECWRWTKNK